MLRKFITINYSLSQQQLQQSKQVFFQYGQQQKLQPLSKLPSLLLKMNIQIPESMLKDYNFSINNFPSSTFSYRQFTHYIARSSLEQQIEQQIKNLFKAMDRKKIGCIYSQDILIFLQDLQGSHQIDQNFADNILDQMDSLKKGYITYQDFVYAMIPK